MSGLRSRLLTREGDSPQQPGVIWRNMTVAIAQADAFPATTFQPSRQNECLGIRQVYGLLGSNANRWRDAESRLSSPLVLLASQFSSDRSRISLSFSGCWLCAVLALDLVPRWLGNTVMAGPGCWDWQVVSDSSTKTRLSVAMTGHSVAAPAGDWLEQVLSFLPAVGRLASWQVQAKIILPHAEATFCPTLHIISHNY